MRRLVLCKGTQPRSYITLSVRRTQRQRQHLRYAILDVRFINALPVSEESKEFPGVSTHCTTVAGWGQSLTSKQRPSGTHAGVPSRCVNSSPAAQPQVCFLRNAISEGFQRTSSMQPQSPSVHVASFLLAGQSCGASQDFRVQSSPEPL